MEISATQYPAPLAFLLRHRGDCLRVTLTLNQPAAGTAFIRTNLGKGVIQQSQTIDSVELGKANLGRDWHDVAMRQVSLKEYQAVLPLPEVGCFEFKAFFLENGTGRTYWPRGGNTCVKVEPASTAAANSIYNAFVRQFGPNLQTQQDAPGQQEAVALLDSLNYTVIPPSGTFRSFAAHLDEIMTDMGFRIIQLLPVHPVPTTYARMGRFGSPFAPLDFHAVDAGMAEFDRHNTPLEQFVELADHIHARNGLLFIDLPANHTGWASYLQIHHPDWFCRNQDGTFQSPGAWGVVWEDLCQLDYQKRELWRAMADIFLHWCHNGVDGFRCDAGYMIPATAWKYIIAKVRREYPDTIFFLEGLGGPRPVTEDLLARNGFNWAYSEIFEATERDAIYSQLDYALECQNNAGMLVNFAETHDNNRLASKSPLWARLRTAMSALLAPAGAFGIANGVEWLATEKIDVHGASSLNWGAQDNLREHLAALNHLLTTHPAFHAEARLRMPFGAEGGAVGLLRIPANPDDAVLVIVNTSTEQPNVFRWNFQEFNPGQYAVDLLSGRRCYCRQTQCQLETSVAPGGFLCLALHAPQTVKAQETAKDKNAKPARRPANANDWQALKANALSFWVTQKGYKDFGTQSIDTLAETLYCEPNAFLRQVLGHKNWFPVMEWFPERAARKLSPIPAGHNLLVRRPHPFRARIDIDGKCFNRQQAVQLQNGEYLLVFPAAPKVKAPTHAKLLLSYYLNGRSVRDSGELLLLPSEGQPVTLQLSQQEIAPVHCALATTDLGGYSLVRAAWGQLQSQYDAFLAANLNPRHPVDRKVLLTRLRAWLVHRDYVQELGLDCQTAFAVTSRQSCRWTFSIPSGMGQNVYLQADLQLSSVGNQVCISFTRLAPPKADTQALPAEDAVEMIVRPDIDFRSAHTHTKAYSGPEKTFPAAVKAQADGFSFTPSSEVSLEMTGAASFFAKAEEWHYNCHHEQDAERGLGADGDLFSPGYFKFNLLGGETRTLEARCQASGQKEPPTTVPQSEILQLPPLQTSLLDDLREFQQSFLVRRDNRHTVIAGYPWFLDWGRDTFICLRGLIAAGKLDFAQDIILQFAQFEQKGTLPNMLRGDDATDRDTSDAPLWFCLAVRDYLAKTGDQQILEHDCGGRSLRQVLFSIADNYLQGTPNGIKACPKTGLVFSPPHFTWMDTNYPVGTPREGYPVEIQALWIAALDFLVQQAGREDLKPSLDLARQSLLTLFTIADKPSIGLSDCLHAKPGVSAKDAVADDHCRPNQLLAITLGAITDQLLKERIIRACLPLVVPGGIRSLADLPVAYALPVSQDGKMLNNPNAPYWGHYVGDEDTRRKPAYHNGTAWGWQLPSLAEALFLTFGDSGRQVAKSLLLTCAGTLTAACLGHLPEILDGDAPHTPRGCPAQAWSETETFRVLQMLE